MGGKDIPIIFSGPMVRALLYGHKTMTRRLLKAEMPTAPGMDAINPANKARHPAPYFDAYCSERKTPENPRGMSRNWCYWTRDDRQCLPTINVRFQPGDRLWVREAWQLHSRATDFGCVVYRASINGSWTEAHEMVPVSALTGKRLQPKPFQMGWRSPLHLFRELSRLTLIVSSVKVERLQDISDEDILAEGVVPFTSGDRRMFGIHVDGGYEHAGLTPRETFWNLWCSLHGPSAWNENPFVTAVSFRVIKANIDAPEAMAAA